MQYLTSLAHVPREAFGAEACGDPGSVATRATPQTRVFFAYPRICRV